MQPPGSGTRGPDQEYTLLLRRTHSRQTIISFPHTLHVLVNNRKLRMGWPSIKRLPSCRAGKVGGRSDSVVARCCSPNDVSPLPSVISEKHYLPSINYLFYPWHFIIFGGAWGDQEQGVDERGKSCWRQLCEKSKLTFAFWLSLSDRRFGGSNTQWARVSMIQRWNNLHSYLKITLSKSWCHEKKGKLRIMNGKDLNRKLQNNNKIYEDKIVLKKRSNTKGIWTENVWIDDKAEKHEMNKIFEISRHCGRCFPWPWIVECAQSIIGFRWLIGGQEELIKIHAWLANPSVTAGPRHAAKDDEACLLFFLSNVVFLRLYRAALPDIKDGREAGVCY